MSADKPSVIPPKGSPERSAYFRDLIAKRWEKPRPVPKETRGPRTLPAGSPDETMWDERARTLGLSDEGMSRTSWRRILKRLAAAELERLRTQGVDSSRPADANDDLLLVYLEREATRLRERAVRDRAFAEMHDKEANDAETRLIAHMRRLGLA
ncbi:hypothetical protein [Microbacterium sp. SMR1]|uniref:hypothetical protein n=1 Tax=Microbacterium sp. SMR1 TaxID=1497340 RepID=UPI000DCD5DA5|nr:hypothetical protein [Microbacterium sp. SMR1]RAZ34814.1 hypothetical protein DO944_03050 [Microbacterium sp. SMR1]